MDNRELVKKLITAKCVAHPRWAELTPAEQTALTGGIESGCFNEAIKECERLGIGRSFANPQFLCRYSARCMAVIGHLTDAYIPSADLLSRIISGEITARGATLLSAEEMCPAASSKERAEIELRQSQKITRNVSHMHTCRKCGHNETVKHDFQMARGDEDSTVSVKCIHCWNVWRY
jgi:DNA-directed RNA polymerase subunit M/transcription elongation factor TFIIS